MLVWACFIDQIISQWMTEKTINSWNGCGINWLRRNLKYPYQHMPGGTEKNHKEPQVSWSVCQQLNPETLKCEVKTIAHSMWCPVLLCKVNSKDAKYFPKYHTYSKCMLHVYFIQMFRKKKHHSVSVVPHLTSWSKITDSTSCCHSL